MIISTGMATAGELDETVSAARQAGCHDIALLKCTSTYPASPENTNTRTIPHMRELFECEVGLSDHTMGIGAAVAAVALGATVIEKHFTLSRSDGGVDSAFSFRARGVRLVGSRNRSALGNRSVMSNTGRLSKKKGLFLFVDHSTSRRTLKQVACSAPTISALLRPGFGLPPKFYDLLLGRRVNRAVKAGTPVSWELFI